MARVRKGGSISRCLYTVLALNPQWFDPVAFCGGYGSWVCTRHAHGCNGEWVKEGNDYHLLKGTSPTGRWGNERSGGFKQRRWIERITLYQPIKLFLKRRIGSQISDCGHKRQGSLILTARENN